MKNPKDLSDEELLSRFEVDDAEHRSARDAVMREVIEMEHEGVHRFYGYASILELCVRELGMDEDELRADLERLAAARPPPRERESHVRIARMKDPPRPPRRPNTPVRRTR